MSHLLPCRLVDTSHKNDYHDEVKSQTKELLKKLNKVNRPFVIYKGHKKGVRAEAGAALYLYSDVINSSSV